MIKRTLAVCLLVFGATAMRTDRQFQKLVQLRQGGRGPKPASSGSTDTSTRPPPPSGTSSTGTGEPAGQPPKDQSGQEIDFNLDEGAGFEDMIDGGECHPPQEEGGEAPADGQAPPDRNAPRTTLAQLKQHRERGERREEPRQGDHHEGEHPEDEHPEDEHHEGPSEEELTWLEQVHGDITENCGEEFWDGLANLFVGATEEEHPGIADVEELCPDWDLYDYCVGAVDSDLIFAEVLHHVAMFHFYDDAHLADVLAQVQCKDCMQQPPRPRRDGPPPPPPPTEEQEGPLPCPEGEECPPPCPEGEECPPPCPEGEECPPPCPEGEECPPPCPEGEECPPPCPEGEDCSQPPQPHALAKVKRLLKRF